MFKKMNQMVDHFPAFRKLRVKSAERMGQAGIVPESDKTQVQADLEAVKAILERTKDQEMSDSDVDELKAAKEKLTQSAQSVFTKMYEQAAQAQQGAQGAGPDMNAQAGGSDAGSTADDDVIDGDFREV